MWGQPSCAWCSMFLCKRQSFPPSRGDGRGHAAALRSAEAASKARVGRSVAGGHEEATVPLVKKRWVPLAWGVGSGAPSTSGTLVHPQGPRKQPGHQHPLPTSITLLCFSNPRVRDRKSPACLQGLTLEVAESSHSVAVMMSCRYLTPSSTSSLWLSSVSSSVRSTPIAQVRVSSQNQHSYSDLYWCHWGQTQSH